MNGRNYSREPPQCIRRDVARYVSAGRTCDLQVNAQLSVQPVQNFAQGPRKGRDPARPSREYAQHNRNHNNRLRMLSNQPVHGMPFALSPASVSSALSDLRLRLKFGDLWTGFERAPPGDRPGPNPTRKAPSAPVAPRCDVTASNSTQKKPGQPARFFCAASPHPQRKSTAGVPPAVAGASRPRTPDRDTWSGSSCGPRSHSSREAAACESPARMCRVCVRKKNRVPPETARGCQPTPN
jgi:hypothetical protein